MHADAFRRVGIRSDGEGDAALKGPLHDDRIRMDDIISLDQAARIDFQADLIGCHDIEEFLDLLLVSEGIECLIEG